MEDTSQDPRVGERDRRIPLAAVVALILICAGGLALRLRGIGCLLPVFTTLDASVIVHQVEMMHHHTEDPAGDPHFAYYPHLLARATSLLPEPERPDPAVAHPLAEHLRAASAPWVQVRIVSALLSLLAIPATWLLARRFLSGAWALLPAALVATSLLHIVFTTQERPHGTAASFMLIAVLAALRLRERGDLGSYLLAGVALGLAVGSLHYGMFAIAAVLAAFLLRVRRGGGASAWWILATFAIVALLFRFFYPFYFSGNSGFLAPQDVQGESAINLSGQPLFLRKFGGRGFVTIFRELWSYDPLILLAALAGAVALAIGLARRTLRLDRERREELGVVLALVVPYFLVIGMYDETWERFLLVLLPYLACLAAYGVCKATTLLAGSSRVPRRIAVASLPALALVPALHLVASRTAPSTFELTAGWVDENLASDVDRVAVFPYLDLPLLHSETALALNAKESWCSNWVRWQMRYPAESRAGRKFQLLVAPKPFAEARAAVEADPIGYFESLGASWVVIGTSPEAHPILRQARDALRARSDLVATFTPSGSDSDPYEAFYVRHLKNVYTDPFFRFVMRMERMGPTFEVYRVER